MGTIDQNQIKSEYYTEAMRYMENAKETLAKAIKRGDSYQDEKYVKTACGIAYSGILKALDGYFILKEIKDTGGKKSIEYYRDNIAKIDRKLMGHLNNAYKILHIIGYYEGVTYVKTIKDGFHLAYTIIDKIKPAA